QALTFCSSCGAMVSASIALASHWNGGLPRVGRPAGTWWGRALRLAPVGGGGEKILADLAAGGGAVMDPGTPGRPSTAASGAGVGDDRARDLARAFELCRGDLRAIPHAVIAELGLFRRRGHSLSPLV